MTAANDDISAITERRSIASKPDNDTTELVRVTNATHWVGFTPALEQLRVRVKLIGH